MSEPDTLLVLAASYDDVAAAEADYEAVKALYHEIETSHEFDAAVIARGEDGKIEVVKKHEQPTRHGAALRAQSGDSRSARCARSFPGLRCSAQSRSAVPAARRLAWSPGTCKGGMERRGPEGHSATCSIRARPG